jgi:hypothetical protein
MHAGNLIFLQLQLLMSSRPIMPTFFKMESCAVLRRRCGTAYLLVSHNKSLKTGIAAAEEEEEEEETPRVTLQQQRQGGV